MADQPSKQATQLMLEFASRTGITSSQPQRRYLWTDAFAVCNFLALEQVTGEPGFLALATRLVELVHDTLGRRREASGRGPWLSGLAERVGAEHPTVGGLRIGKPLQERAPDEPFDERLEWERDGQYFHYLTRWMHALDQVARATGEAKYGVWARELAAAAHHAFVYHPEGRAPRMHWKMSLDLSRPQVPSMGQHDALDGLVTCLQLGDGASGAGPSLEAARADFASMVDASALATADPLGLGGLLVDAARLVQLEPQTGMERGLAGALVEAARIGLAHYLRQPDLRAIAGHRLAFRELGLAIGLKALPLLARETAGRPPAGLDELLRVVPTGDAIIAFWLDPEHQRAEGWTAHLDINQVMLATALAPEGYLVRRPRRGLVTA